MLRNCIAVGVGGMLGSVLRYLIGLIPIHNQSGFPYKTLFINVLGSFVIAAVTAMAAEKLSLNPRLVLLLKTGVCGGFTTFSTFSQETMTLLQSGESAAAALYMLSSVLLSLGAAFLGDRVL